MIDPLLLIDGDVFLYNATLSSEYETQWDENTHVLASNYDEAHQGFLNQINFVKNRFSTDKVRIAFTKGGTFRHTIYPQYKNNRVDKRKPLCFTRLRDQIEQDFKCLSIPGLEADDVLGIWATRDAHLTPIIVSADKDLKTIPGRLFRQGELIESTEADADNFWMTQALTGDVTDGYKGCPGMGPAKAAKLFDPGSGASRPLNVSEMWTRVVEAYEKANLDAAYALTQARLARILRIQDWDAMKKEPILWTPAP